MASQSDGLQGKPAAGLAPVNTRLRALLIVITLLVLGVFLVPRLQALYYQIQGGQIIDRILRSGEGASLGPVACDFHISGEASDVERINQAIAYLQTSARQNPRSSQTYLLLGRAFCLLDQPQQAVDAYRTYTELRPLNPLGHQELGFAIEALCRQSTSSGPSSQTTRPNSVCNESDLQSQIIGQWRKAGIVVGQFVVEGDQAFARGDYRSAERWYQRSAIYNENPSSASYFQWSVASVLSGLPLPDFQGAYAPDVYTITSTVQIEAENLYWLKQDSSWKLNYGDRLKDHPSNDPTLGVMWWAGRAIAFVQVPNNGTYEITVRVNQNSPSPMLLQIERDMTPIDQFKLSDGNQGWRELTTATVLESGLHIIGINYLEDTSDAILDWIKILKVQSSVSS